MSMIAAHAALHPVTKHARVTMVSSENTTSVVPAAIAHVCANTACVIHASSAVLDGRQQ